MVSKNNKNTTEEVVEEVKFKPVPKSEKVELNREDLERLMKRLDDQDKTINLLVKSADKGRYSKALNDSSNTSLIRTVRVSKYTKNGKIIMGWKMTHDQCEIVAGRWVEDQRTMLIFEDGTEEEVTLLDFYRKIAPIEGEIVSRTEKQDDSILKVSFPDGKEIEISAKFVNQS